MRMEGGTRLTLVQSAKDVKWSLKLPSIDNVLMLILVSVVECVIGTLLGGYQIDSR